VKQAPCGFEAGVGEGGAREVAMRSGAMPPPTGTSAILPRWRRWAEAMNAKLDVARLSIAGARRDAGSLSFDDEGGALGTTIAFTTDRTLAGAPPPDLAARVTSGTLCIDAHAVALDLPTHVADPAALGDTFALLESIAASIAIDGPHGPYR